MKAVVLCAGYGTRLSNDLKNDETGAYSHLIGVPKPLLPVGYQPLICHWLDIFSSTPEITEVVIVSNEVHYKMYEALLDSYMNPDKNFKVCIISDGSTCNENRSGAVCCMKLGAGNFMEDVLFIAGDSLFHHTFILSDMIAKFYLLKNSRSCNCLLISTPVSDVDVSKRGIIEVDEQNCVLSFLEKPSCTETQSRLQSPCLYIMSQACSSHLEAFLLETKYQPLSSRDAPGNFIKFLVTVAQVYAYHVISRFDIGNLQMYIECNKNFKLK